jgi:hypothetical protein
MYVISVCACGTLKITLSGSVQTFVEGTYEEHITINGSPSWLSTNKLFSVYYSPFDKNWVISGLSPIGIRNFAFIFAKSDGEEKCPKDVPSTSWQHSDAISTSVADPVVTIECLASRNERKNF